MQLKFETITYWDETWWERLGPIYREAFPHGSKPEKVLRSMLNKGIACMHAGTLDGEAAAMAVAGFSGPVENRRLILDYMAIRRDLRGKGLGAGFFKQIRDWAASESQAQAIIIEAEADDTEENRSRLKFWERCGFIATSYLHQYIWVPEPYRALYLPLSAGFAVTDDGQSLFRDITSFHHKSFRGH